MGFEPGPSRPVVVCFIHTTMALTFCVYVFLYIQSIFGIYLTNANKDDFHVHYFFHFLSILLSLIWSIIRLYLFYKEEERIKVNLSKQMSNYICVFYTSITLIRYVVITQIKLINCLLLCVLYIENQLAANNYLL